MRSCRILAVDLGLIAASLISGQSAWATVDNFKSLKLAYPTKNPKTYSCKTCHQNAVGKKGDLNPYGLALQKSKGAGKATKLTSKDYKAIEKEDSDKDGVSNLDEITAGTLPGDATSLPKKEIAPKPKLK